MTNAQVINNTLKKKKTPQKPNKPILKTKLHVYVYISPKPSPVP